MSPQPGAGISGDALELPPYSLDVETLDLGPGVQSVGLELIETENREPLTGKLAAEIWSAVFPALAVDDCMVVDFFSHLDRVMDFCHSRSIHFRQDAGRCLVVPKPRQSQLFELFERFENETFGIRTGAPAEVPDPLLEGDLSARGLDAYQPAYERYAFCAVCELEDGWVTLLSKSLWASEIIRRVRPAVQPLNLYIARAQ